MKKFITLALALLLPAALAHAVVRTDAGGTESLAGKYETYRLQVPVEKDSDTTTVRLALPAGLKLSGVMPLPGWTWSAEKDANGDVTAVTWTGDLKPMEFARFYFQAVNPADPATLAWKVDQTYADGTVVHWDDTDPATPASKTTVK